VKTTVDLPDALFRKAKATAAELGISLKQFITKAVESRLANPLPDVSPGTKPWIRILESHPRVPKKVLVALNRRVAEADAADITLQQHERP